jgi:hypothetical protein
LIDEGLEGGDESAVAGKPKPHPGTTSRRRRSERFRGGHSSGHDGYSWRGNPEA